MSSFVARVELHGVRHDSDIYAKLHAQMEVRGFSRTISGTANDGLQRTWRMPPAQYYLEGDLGLAQVRDRASAAASAVGYPTGSHSAVLVTEGTSGWDGLQLA